jgi:PAS domain S-box-containing protein
MKIKDKGNDKLRVLYLEDSAQDVEIVRETLIGSGFDLEMDSTESEQEFVSFLHRNTYDIILSDFKLPAFDAFGALRRVLEICPIIPFICVSGTIGEETAVDLLKQGAVDYVLKDRLARLPVAIRRALDEAKEKEILRQAQEALQESESRYRSILQSATDAIVTVDSSGIIIGWNSAAERTFGYSYTEAVGQPLISIVSFCPLDDHTDRMMGFQSEGGQDAIGKTGIYNGFRKDKSEFPIELSLSSWETKSGQFFTGIVRDITERKRAEEALSESERKLNEAQKMAQLGNWTWDVRTGNVEWSEEVFKTFQLDPKAFTPQIDSILSLSPWPEDHERDKELIRRAMESQEKGSYEQRFLLPDKSVGYYYSTFQGKYDDGGNLIFIVGTVQDITERKLAEESLQKSEERFRSLYENSTVGLYRTTPEGKIILANPTLVKMLGYVSFEELTARNLEQEGFGPTYEWKHFIEQIELNGEVKGLESVWNRKDGSTLFVRESARAIRDPNGKTVYYDGSVEDITERKRAEEALNFEQNLLRSLMDTVPDHIYFKDLNSRFLRMSKSQAEKFGLSDPAQAIGKTDFDFFTEDHARPAYEHEQEIIKTNIPLVNIEEKETWHGGRETWVSTTKVPLRDLTGQIIGTFGISRDVTEQKKLQSQLMQTQKVQSIGTLAGGIAHDFNNILGIILAYTGILERSGTDAEKISKSTTAITQAVSRGAALVRQILTFARQTGALVKPLLIPDLIRELVAMLQETFPEVIEFQLTIEIRHRCIRSC